MVCVKTVACARTAGSPEHRPATRIQSSGASTSGVAQLAHRSKFLGLKPTSRCRRRRRRAPRRRPRSRRPPRRRRRRPRRRRRRPRRRSERGFTQPPGLDPHRRLSAPPSLLSPSPPSSTASLLPVVFHSTTEGGSVHKTLFSRDRREISNRKATVQKPKTRPKSPKTRPSGAQLASLGLQNAVAGAERIGLQNDTTNPDKKRPPATHPSMTKADSTRRFSRAVPHRGTNRAFRCLTSEFKWDRVFSTKYGRQRRQHPGTACY